MKYHLKKDPQKIVDAFQWDGSMDLRNAPPWASKARSDNLIQFDLHPNEIPPVVMWLWCGPRQHWLVANSGDWILRDSKGHLYWDHPNSFAERYEEVQT